MPTSTGDVWSALALGALSFIPEAFHNSPRFSGLFAAFGFGLLLLVDATTR
jgi:hypothetical protein